MDKVDIIVDNLLSKEAAKIPRMNQLVIITTINTKGVVNAAVKSEVIHALTEPPVFGFSCNLGHHTCQNILEQHEFVINIPGEDIVDKAMKTAHGFPAGVNELDEAGLQALPSKKVKPPRIAECVAHFECREEWHDIRGEEILIFGRVVAASLNKDLYEASIEERFRIARPVVVLGEYRYSPVHEVKKLPGNR
jgi:flavin reductase (DIM6/NTAB) family NADH-FMN oxidoreductase RutF